MEVGEPSLLTRLPRVGLFEHGRTHLGQVYGITERARKKRHELCAAVDGNSVNIIEVVNGNILSSFPVPPDARFLCPPCSSRSQISRKRFLRRTYCLVNRRGIVSVQCHIEQKDETSSEIQTLNTILQSDCEDVVLLQSSSDDKELLVLQETGKGVFFNENASSQSRQVEIRVRSGDLKILSACWLSIEDAKSSVLRSRTDLSTSMTPDTSIIMGIYQSSSSDELHLGVWPVLSSSSSDVGNSLDPIIDHHLSLKVPNASKSRTKFTFGQKGQKLEIETASMQAIFDTTGVVPRKISEQQHLTSGTIGMLDLSNHLVLSATNSAFHLFNSKYRSLIASVNTKSASLKRKRDVPKIGGAISLVAYFPQLKRVVALNQNQLLAIDIRYREDMPQTLKQSSLLLGSIGRGSPVSSSNAKLKSTTIGTPRQLERVSTVWNSKIETLDNLAISGSVEQFQQDFIQDITGDPQMLPTNSATIPDFKLNYLITALFEVISVDHETPDGSSKDLHLKLHAFKLVHWCIKHGLLTTFRIERALANSHGDHLRPKIKPGAVALALVEADDSLDLAQYYVEHSPYLSPKELAVLTRELVRSAILQSSTLKESGSIRTPMLMADKSTPEKSVVIFPVPPTQRVIAPRSLRQCLKVTLTRFISIGQSNVLAEMKALMNSTDIVALIQFLRQQLFLGGYTRFLKISSFPSPPTSREGDGTIDEGPKETADAVMSLKDITVLLSSCVDAIGPVGLRSFDEDEKFISTLIPDLLSEISSASDALEESVYLQGLLRETLRYTESVQRQPQHIKARLRTQNNERQGVGNIITLYSEPESKISSTIYQSALPVSLRVDSEISKIKVRKGGGQVERRSSREMGMLQDRQRSIYSFERLVL